MKRLIWDVMLLVVAWIILGVAAVLMPIWLPGGWAVKRLRQVVANAADQTRIRWFGVGCFVAGGLIGGLVPVGCGQSNRCPAYSFYQPWVLQAERAIGAVVVGIFVSAMFWYVVVKGRMPSEFSTDGLKLSGELPVKQTDALDQLTKANTEHKGSIDALSLSMEGTTKVIKNLEDRVARLEGR